MGCTVDRQARVRYPRDSLSPFRRHRGTLAQPTAYPPIRAATNASHFAPTDCHGCFAWHHNGSERTTRQPSSRSSDPGCRSDTPQRCGARNPRRDRPSGESGRVPSQMRVVHQSAAQGVSRTTQSRSARPFVRVGAVSQRTRVWNLAHRVPRELGACRGTEGLGRHSLPQSAGRLPHRRPHHRHLRWRPRLRLQGSFPNIGATLLAQAARFSPVVSAHRLAALVASALVLAALTVACDSIDPTSQSFGITFQNDTVATCT